MSDILSSSDPQQDDTSNSRASLAALIQSFLASEITAFEFDERLDPFRDSKDPVIRCVVDAVWYHYDDCDNHLVCLSKQQWDYFQRLLLVLASHGRLRTEAKRLWSLKQLVAATSLCLFCSLVPRWGWGEQLLILAMPFGLISIALSVWQPRLKPDRGPFTTAIYPFATFTDLATAYHAAGFRKTRYPKHIGDRRIRSRSMEVFWRLYCYALWLMFSPVPLLWQIFPLRQSRTYVVSTG